MAKKCMVLKAKKTPKFRVRKHSRCNICGRPRGYMQKFGICRICFRSLSHQGALPGITKSSW